MGGLMRIGILTIIGLILWFSAVKPAHGAENAFLQATAVYGVIATDPVYLWMAQEKGFFKKNGLDSSKRTA